MLSALQDELWDARDARVMVVGSNLQARAIYRELSKRWHQPSEHHLSQFTPKLAHCLEAGAEYRSCRAQPL
ncbi:MAG: hypothetical protein R2865_07365 [Deinococcales bacterium]